MAEKSGRRTWVWVVVGLIVVLVIGFVAFVGLSMVVVTRNMQITQADERSAEEAFEETRERFAGQTPLVTLKDDATVSRAELDRRIAAYSGPPPQNMWVMAWDRTERRLIKMSIPFWLLRMSPSGRVSIDLPGVGTRESSVTMDEIERAGPGLFMDGTVEGSMILVWTE